MTPAWITTHAGLAQCSPAWDAGVAAAGSDNPFLRSEFLQAWSAAFVPPDHLQILVCREGEAIVAGLPLYRARRRGIAVLRGVGIGFANLTEPFFCGERADFERAWGEQLRSLPGWHYLNLPLVRSAWLARPTGIPGHADAGGSDGRVRLIGDAEAYLATLRPKMQANLRRCLRRAAEVGPLTLRRVTEPADVAAMIEFQLRHNGPDRYPPDTVVTASRPAWAAFTRQLLQLLAQRGQLDAMALRAGSDLAAVGFGYRQGPGYKSLLTSYDPKFRPIGPGLLFFHHLIDWCRQQGDPFLEMYGDSNDWEKRRWCNEFEPLHQLRFFRPSLVGAVLRAGVRVWQR